MNLDQFLEKASQTWGETVKKANENSFNNPPDGTYTMQLASATLKESAKGNPQIVWDHVILDGDQIGQHKKDYMGLDRERSMEFLAYRLRSFGIRLEDVNISKLQDVLDGLSESKPIFKCALSTPEKSDFQNMRVLQLLPGYDSEEGGGDYGSTDDDYSGADASGEEQAELRVGMKVEYDDADQKINGVGLVTGINEQDGTATIDSATGGGSVETVRVPFSCLSIVDEGTDA